MTTYDFQDGKGPVPAHKHSNGGGWVAETASVSETSYVGPEAMVYGYARVYENARVYGYAMVRGDARVYGDAMVRGNATVYGNTNVRGNANVYGDAIVYGNARVYGDASVKRGSYRSSPLQIIRSDGYSFTLQSDSSVVAGCRNFTMAEALKYWGDPEHHMHKESYAIVKSLISISKAIGEVK